MQYSIKTNRTMKAYGIPSVLLFICMLPVLSHAQVQVTQKSMAIPTYEVGEADPNPSFYNGRRYQGAQGRVYPYPLIHNLSDNKVDKEYDFIILENEYVEIAVLPELGGRLYYAKDKSNDYYYIYHNRVVKPGLIGMTGAWVSGGVEWNIPHHHRATSFSPVDYTVTEHADGSKTVWVGETEWRHRSKWMVGLTLHPGSSLLETTTRIFNTTAHTNSMLSFANAAVHANENYQVIFPPKTQYATYHRKNQFSEWPVSNQRYDGADYTEGVDVSRWVNHSKSSSFFEWGNKGNFVAGIDHGQEAGTIIFGNRHINPGKKLWSWGNNPNGAMWDTVQLTDADGPYIELMFGSFSDNQPDYSWMHPLETKESTYWFAPIKGIGNVHKVNNDAMVSLDYDGNTIDIGVNATRRLDKVIISLTAAGEEVFSEVADMDPHAPFRANIEHAGSWDEYSLTLAVTDADGNTLIQYSPESVEGEPMPEPVSSPRAASDIQNADSLYYAGLSFEQFHDAYYQPRDFYLKAIELNPQHVPSLLRTGILFLKDGDYSSAAGYLEKAVDRVTWDYTTAENADALYYLALAYNETERRAEAYDLFYRASWDQSFHTAAHYQMALMKGLEGRYDRALEHLEEAYSTNTRSVDVLSLQASLYRRTGEREKAEHTVDQLLKLDPLNFRALNEQFLISNNSREPWDLMRNDRENYLELAVDYGNAGLFREALDVLERGSASEDEALSGYPLIYYYLGYYHHQLGHTAKAVENFRLAGQKSHEGVFPFRYESVKALGTALDYNPGDGRAWYYTGNIYYDVQPDLAIEAWEKAVALNDGIAVAYRNLAFAYANVEHDLAATLENMDRALQLNTSDPRYLYENDLYLKTIRTDPSARLQPFSRNVQVATSDNQSLFPYVELLTLTGNYSEAIDLMENHHFRRWEGGGSVYPYWIYSHLFEAIDALDRNALAEAGRLLNASISYPANLQTVRHASETMVFYYQGILAEKNSGRAGVTNVSHNSSEAEQLFRSAAGGRNRDPEGIYYAAKAHEKLNEAGRAESLYRSLIRSGEQDLSRDVTMDFFNPFATVRSGDDLKAGGYYKMALGYMGLGDTNEAHGYYARAVEHDPSLLSLTFGNSN
ncbi:MAG: DUF5107 domain-containing protein [Balneolales bacterium]